MENQSIRFGALPPAVQNAILQSQQDEENGAQVYAYMARHEKDPHNRDILLHMSQDEKALADFARAIELNPKNPEVYKKRGMFYQTRQKMSEAEKDFNQAIALEPNNPFCYFKKYSPKFKKTCITIIFILKS